MSRLRAQRCTRRYNMNEQVQIQSGDFQLSIGLRYYAMLMFIYSYERLGTTRIFFGPPLAWEGTKLTEFKQIKFILTN